MAPGKKDLQWRLNVMTSLLGCVYRRTERGARSAGSSTRICLSHPYRLTRREDYLNEESKIGLHALVVVPGESHCIDTFPIVVDVAERFSIPRRSMLLEKLGLYRQTPERKSCVNTMTQWPPLRVRCAIHLVHPQFVEKTPTSCQVNGIRDCASVLPGS